MIDDAPPPPPDASRARRRVRTAIVAALLVGAAAFVYRGVGGFDFVNLDDPDYVTGNPTVLEGLRWSGVRWAFATFHAANWHPLTWLSHMGDASLFGRAAGGHHLTSLALHAANAIVLFLLLRALTGSFWRCAAVAALFAVHPVQVESVAWVAERKTVLATLLGLLALRAYVWRVARPRGGALAVVALLFGCGLLAKPLLVVLPLLLLLLDWWPLDRFGRRGGAPGRVRAAVVEKLPLFALSLLSGIVTIAAQSRVGGVATLEQFPLSVRVGNALLSAVAYLGSLFLPRDLTVYYPHPSGDLRWGAVALAAAALAAVSVVAARVRRRAPWAAFGWLWFLATLLPVIGIIQVGAQARADRYLYLPLAGVFLAVLWGGAEFARRRPPWRAPIALSVAAAVALLALAAQRQTAHWRDSLTLWDHALAVHPDSEMALYQLSEHHQASGRFREQAALLRRLVALNPRHERAFNNLVVARYRLGEPPAALTAEYEALLARNPKNVKALQNYGFLLIAAGRPAAAIGALERAIELDPAYCTAINNLGRAHLATGDKAAARRQFEKAAACDPGEAKYRANIDRAR